MDLRCHRRQRAQPAVWKNVMCGPLERSARSRLVDPREAPQYPNIGALRPQIVNGG